MTVKKNNRRLLQGNEALVEGALAAGCNFYAGYPITPASEISELLSYRLPQIGGTYIQMEDEIASMGAIIGASLAGSKTMTATSGPGFSLMQENLSYACMVETPCVIVNVMRGGPSTGLPTSPSQGDVMQARWGAHGDHPIIVLSVSTVIDSFDIIIKAFNFSEKYRIPIIVLSDELTAHTREAVSLPAPEDYEVINRAQPSCPPEWFRPYGDNSRGVPPMAEFGDGYRHHVTGLMHDTKGFPTNRADETQTLMNRLFRKIRQGFGEIQLTEPFMLDDAEIAVIAYGSVARSAHRAVIEARETGIKAGMLKLITLFPFPRHSVEMVLKQCRAVLVPEMNLGQMKREVKRVNEGQSDIKHYNRFDGQFITPLEILNQLKRM